MPDDKRKEVWGEPSPRRRNLETYRTLSPEAPRAPGEQTDLPPTDELLRLQIPSLPEPHWIPEVIAGRYERRELLGRGGMGVVWRCWDRSLRRPVALKVLHARLVGAHALARFEEEAQISAQLQHPGIIPVHGLGRLPDGRMWFAMKEVEGQTLESLLAEVHDAWRRGVEQADGFTFRRLLGVFLRVCEAVAYAHTRGVLHRDLKPSNVMVGAFGEVLVLDWGLARVLGTSEQAVDVQSVGSAHQTRAGEITGTPAYMAPEQARGASDLGPATDVYALGATLYDLLAERPPRLERSAAELLARVAAADPIRPPSEVAEGPQIDGALDQLCMRALEPDPADRYPDAGAMAAELARWLDGARRREQAMALIDEADERLDEADEAEVRATALSGQADEALGALPAGAPSSEKLAPWALQDEAAELRRRSNATRTRAVQLLRSALSHAPELTDAHDRLADHFLAQHRALEADGEAMRAATALSDLAEHDRSHRYVAYLRGTGALSLVTEPPGAQVRLHRYVERGRRLEPVLDAVLGTTPLRAVPIEMGSYLITLHAEGHEVVRYPVLIRRQEHWDGIPPGGSEPSPIRLPAVGELGSDDCYVPAGWSWIGDDELPATLPLQRLWVPPLVVQRFVVTTGQYLDFLNALLEQGQEALALGAQPILSEAGGPWLERGPDGRWSGIRTDHDGPIWDILRSSPRVPAVYLDASQVEAYARWLSSEGASWRLPTELEWQRVGRGADRREYPWGDHFEPSWTRARSSGSMIHILPVGRFPIDRSPFGVCGQGGNVSEWAHNRDGEYYGVGGSCASGPLSCRLTYRTLYKPEYRSGRLGFRLVRDFV